MMILTEQIPNKLLILLFLFLFISYFWERKNLKMLYDIIKGKKSFNEWEDNKGTGDLVFLNVLNYIILWIAWIFLVLKKFFG